MASTRKNRIPDNDSALFQVLATIQGVYFLCTGVWPIVHISSFEAISGPKQDDWLVKTVGVLVAIIGTVLLVAGRRGRASSDIALLAAGSAAGLGGIDLVYVARRTISRVYLLDALAEFMLLTAWLIQLHRR